MRSTFLAALTMALLAGVFPSSARAQTYGGYPGYVGGPNAYLTYLTFSAPVQVPGAVLPAGTYAFRRIAPRVIQVVGKDQTTVYAMFTTIPRMRTTTTHTDEVVFGETHMGMPPTVEVWFPAHLRIGDEFLYSKMTCCGQRAAQLALK